MQRQVWIVVPCLMRQRGFDSHANRVGQFGVFARQNDFRGAVFDHERQTFDWIIRIQGHVSRAAFQNGQFGRYQIGRAFYQQRDVIAGVDAEAD